MKKVININFQGRVIPIEETAYEILQRYTESLRVYFSNEEGKDEIINDIEGRIAELFSEVLAKGSTCITDADVNAIIKSIGRPEDFAADDATAPINDDNSKEKQTPREETFSTDFRKKLYRNENDKILGGVCSGLADYFGVDPAVMRVIFVLLLFFGLGFIAYIILWVAVPSTATRQIGSARKRLMRDPENKVIGGVCSGLAHYFNINVWIPRLIFLIPFLSFAFQWHDWGMWNFPHFLNISFSPGATMIYIILWIILPEAKTTSERLEMKGEKVDLTSIKNSITSEMKGVQERVSKLGKEAAASAKEKSQQISGDVSGAARRGRRTIGDVIGLFFKIIAYFILAVIVIAVVGALFGIGIALTGMLPLKDYLITSGWQNVFAWGTLVLFIWVPVVGVITWIIRKITRSRANSAPLRFGFIALWVLGWICVFGLLSTLGKDFSSRNNVREETIRLSDPSVQKLEVKAMSMNKYYNSNFWFHLEPFADVNSDSVYIRNVRIRVVKAERDSLFHVKMVRLSNGSSKSDADRRANNIDYSIYQEDSILMLGKGIAITPQDKFRNQSIIVTISVPVGKRILIHKAAGWGNYDHVHFGWDDNDWGNRYYDEEAEEWSDDVEYIMTVDGLKPTHPEDDKLNNQNWEEDDHFRFDENGEAERLQEIERQKRQLEEEKRNIEKSLKDEGLKIDTLRYEYRRETPTKPAVKQSVTVLDKATGGKVTFSGISIYSTKRFTM